MFHRFVGTLAEQGEGEIYRANSNLGQNQIIDPARTEVEISLRINFQFQIFADCCHSIGAEYGNVTSKINLFL